MIDYVAPLSLLIAVSTDSRFKYQLTTSFRTSSWRNSRDRYNAIVINAVMDASWFLPFYIKHTETVVCIQMYVLQIYL